MSSRPPDLAPAPAPPASRPLSTAAAIAVTGVTAALVLAVGVFVAERVGPPRRNGPPPPLPKVVIPDESAASIASIASIASASAVPIASASAAPIASASAAPIASASAVPIASATAAPIASTVASASASAAPVSAGSLPDNRGILIVSGPPDTLVFINGARVGAPEEPLVVPCRPLFVRLGVLPAGARRPSWVGAGQSVIVRCRTETRATLGEAGKP